jgi:hypothetical protein
LRIVLLEANSVIRTPVKSAALVFCEEFHPDEINFARVE